MNTAVMNTAVMNEIACLVKEPTKPAKFAVVDIKDEEKVAEIIGVKEMDLHVFKGRCARCAVICDARPEKNHKTYNCSIQGEHFYGAIIIAGITGNNMHDIILTPGFIEKFIPAEDKYER